jgi:hypothetical protein
VNETNEMPVEAFRQRLLGDLAPMASLAYQRRYIVHGDVHSYRLPDELLDLLHNGLTQFRSRPEYHSAFSIPQFAALGQLLTILDEFPTYIDDVSNEELVERHPAWMAIRDQSVICLRLLGFDLAQWDANEINDNTSNG